MLFPGMKRLSENSVIDIKNRSFTVTAAIETPTERDHRRRAHRPGRPVRRLGALRQGRPRQVRLQRPRHAGVRHRGDRTTRPPAATRSAPSSPTTAAAWPRAATSRSTTTAAPSAAAVSTDPAADLLRRRDHRHRRRLRNARQRATTPTTSKIQRPHRRRPDRRRRRRPLPPHRPGRSREGRNRPPISNAVTKARGGVTHRLNSASFSNTKQRQSRAGSSVPPTLLQWDATSHADRHGHGCPFAPATQRCGGADHGRPPPLATNS